MGIGVSALNPHVAAVVLFVMTAVVAETGGSSDLEGQVAASIAGDPQAVRTAATVVGTAVDASTGKGLEGVIVSISGTAISRRTATLADGRFTFQELPAGRYVVLALKAGYLEGGYGRRRPLGDVAQIEIPVRQLKGPIIIPLWKLARISGFVLDEAGEPVVSARVDCFRRDAVAGRWRLVRASSVVTDDRGFYTIAALRPGSYVVGTAPTLTTVPRGLFQGHPALSERGRSVGGSLVLSSNAPEVLVEAEPDLKVYAPHFFGGVQTASEAATVTLTAGEDQRGVDLFLRPVTAVRVTGKLIGPDGPLPLAWASLVTKASYESGLGQGFAIAAALSDDTGSFAFTGVPAGDYLLVVTHVPFPRHSQLRALESVAAKLLAPEPDTRDTFALMAPPAEQTLWAREAVSVGADDVSITVALQRGARVRGRVNVDGRPGSPSPATIVPVVVLEQADGRNAGPLYRGPVNPDGSFETYGVPAGRYLVRVVTRTEGWFLASAMWIDADRADVPIELVNGDIDNVLVTVTDKPLLTVAGVVTSLNGVPDPDATVLVFPMNPRQWTDFGTTPRRLRSARSNENGSYAISGLPPGEYFVAAVPDAAAADWQRPDFLATLVRSAAHARLSEGGSVVNLRR